MIEIYSEQSNYSENNFKGPPTLWMQENFYGWVHITANCLNTRGSHRMCSIKKVSLKISQYSQENTCASLFFKQHVYWASLLKNRLWHRSFPVNFATFFRTLFLQNTSGWLLLFYNRCWLYTLQLCIAGNSKVKRGH